MGAVPIVLSKYRPHLPPLPSVGHQIHGTWKFPELSPLLLRSPPADCTGGEGDQNWRLHWRSVWSGGHSTLGSGQWWSPGNEVVQTPDTTLHNTA